MSTVPPRFEGETLRRTRSTGDIPTRDVTRPETVRITPSYRYSESHTQTTDVVLQPRAVAFDEHVLTSRTDPPPIGHRAPISYTPRRPWSPPPTVAEDPDHASIHTTPLDEAFIPLPAPRRPNMSIYARTMAFFGYGRNASRVRREFVSLIWNLGWGLVQVVTIITVLVFAAHHESPNTPGKNEWEACGRPLGVWSCLWLVRVFSACGLSYWGWRRERKTHPEGNEGDLEAGRNAATGQTSPPRTANATAPRTATQTPGTVALTGTTNAPPPPPPLPYTRLFHRLTLISSFLTLTWFLTAHILEYTSVHTCRQSSPHLWWLTFGILCIMYIMVLEVFLLGFVVFIVAPILFIFWNILLICLGRHPLQNPTMIKPEIGKLPKSTVDRIPLVIYIPPPPDEPSDGPIKIPDSVYSYPPKQMGPTKPPKRRFAFLRNLSSFRGKGGGKGVGGSSGNLSEKDGGSKGKGVEKSEPLTWEDHWEQGDYPFVRLEGNRASCAICLMDFEEPKKIAGVESQGDGEGEGGKGAAKDEGAEDEGEQQVQEIPVERATDVDTSALIKLAESGEGAEPLRLLTCGHVFHKTCLDPWLIDVSGRCPICQRPVELPELAGKKKGRRNNNSNNNRNNGRR